MKGSCIILTVVAVLVFISCTSDPNAGTGTSLRVVCTTGMITDMVKRIGGDKIRVDGLMGPGVDPHMYKAAQGDIMKLGHADVIFYNGLHLEGKMIEIFAKMSRTKSVIAVTGNIDTSMLINPEGRKDAYDPHVWFDVALWMQTIDVVCRELAGNDTAHAALYKANADSYRDQLQNLHNWVKTEIASIPERQRVLITAHDAFSYFGRAYDIEVTGLQGISTISEYGVHDVSRLVDFITERGVKAIFVESSVPQRSINAVKEGCSARGFNVRIGGTLYSDALGGPGSNAENYIDMVRRNVMTIVGALK